MSFVSERRLLEASGLQSFRHSFGRNGHSNSIHVVLNLIQAQYYVEFYYIIKFY